jgi:hypothetical protein
MSNATHVSPIDAAARAFAQMKHALFPVRLERWLALGFVAFLDQCGRSGGGSGGNFGNRGRTGNEGEMLRQGLDWVGAHMALVAAIVVGVLVLVIALMALALWLNSRGTFMYIDNVATNRADVQRPWSEHRRHANSYFGWKFGIALATLCLVILTLVAAAVAVANGLRHGFGGWGIAALVCVALVFLAIIIAATLMSVLLRDFVAPVQLLRDVPCGAALRLVATVLRTHLGPVLLYLVLKLCYSLLAAMIVLTLVCGTCCVALCFLVLPVISQAILQPLLYFERAWSLQLLAAMGLDLMEGLAVEHDARP